VQRYDTAYAVPGFTFIYSCISPLKSGILLLKGGELMDNYDIYEGEKIVAVKKNAEGDIQAFKTSSGRQISYQDAIEDIQNNYITGVNVFKGKDGEVYIRGNADENPDNNLDNLPTF
jgi:hypothetical protein